MEKHSIKPFRTLLDIALSMYNIGPKVLQINPENSWVFHILQQVKTLIVNQQGCSQFTFSISESPQSAVASLNMLVLSFHIEYHGTY